MKMHIIITMMVLGAAGCGGQQGEPTPTGKERQGIDGTDSRDGRSLSPEPPPQGGARKIPPPNDPPPQGEQGPQDVAPTE
jgi:hypothetical protein